MLGHFDDIYEGFTRGEDTDSIYLDYAKAFDKVDSNLLMYKLKKYGFHGKLIEWIKSFLFDREQVVVLKGAGGPRPKIIFNVIFVEGRQSYQMLFTGSKNIDPSRIYCIFKIAKYIQLPFGRALYSRLSQNFKF